MDLIEILKILIPSAIIPSFFTFLGTRTKYKSKIKEITIMKDAETNNLIVNHAHEIDSLNTKHKNDIEKLKTDHFHSLEMLQIQYDLNKNERSDDFSNKLADEFLHGSLNFDNVANNFDSLNKLTKKVDKLKQKQDMSNFVKKK